MSAHRTDQLGAAARYTAATGPRDTPWGCERRRNAATDVYRAAFDTAVLHRITNLCKQAAEPEPPR